MNEQATTWLNRARYVKWGARFAKARERLADSDNVMARLASLGSSQADRFLEVVAREREQRDTEPDRLFIAPGEYQLDLPVFVASVAGYVDAEHRPDTLTDLVLLALQRRRRGQSLPANAVTQFLEHKAQIAASRAITALNNLSKHLRQSSWQLPVPSPVEAQTRRESIEPTRLFLRLQDHWLAGGQDGALEAIEAQALAGSTLICLAVEDCRPEAPMPERLYERRGEIAAILSSAGMSTKAIVVAPGVNGGVAFRSHPVTNDAAATSRTRTPYLVPSDHRESRVSWLTSIPNGRSENGNDQQARER